MNKVTKPNRLQEQDQVALFAPSHKINKERLQIALNQLKLLNLKVIHKKVLRDHVGFAGSIKDRIKELHDHFANPKIKGIFALRGGSGALQLLNHLDFDLIKNNPKILVGCSDITTLLLAIHKKNNLVTFHGPNAGSPWTQKTLSFYKNILFNKTKCIPYNTRHNYLTLNEGNAQGILVGGNLTCLASLLGTKFSPSYKNIILFLEDIHEESYKITRLLTQLELAQVFDSCRGIVFGQFTKNSLMQFKNRAILKSLQAFMLDYKIPSFAGADIGHISSQLILPIGCRVTINASQGSINIIESPTL